MPREVALQAAPLSVAARAFSIPPRHLRRAVRLNELQLFGTGSGRASVLIFDDVRAWLRTRPKAKSKGDGK
jgi:hypothetical protein